MPLGLMVEHLDFDAGHCVPFLPRDGIAGCSMSLRASLEVLLLFLLLSLPYTYLAC